MRNALAMDMGIPGTDPNDYNGLLLENLVASSLYNLKDKYGFRFNMFFDTNEGGVDFLIQKGFEKPVPVEVGIGNKSPKQVWKSYW